MLLYTSQRAFRSKSSAFRWVTVFALLASSGICPAQADDAASEARSINQQVNALLKTSDLGQAETLAKKGLLLCDSVGDVKVFCASQFDESLGDIAFTQKQYDSALAYYEQALRVRETGLGNAHPLVSRSLQRLGKVYLMLNRIPEAEAFVQRAILGFEKLPAGTELALALGYLRNIYFTTGRLSEAKTAAERELKVYEAIGNVKGVSDTKLNLSSIQAHQAQNLIGKSNYPDAEKLLVQAIKLIDPPPPGAEKAFVALQAHLGDVYERQRRYAEAEPFMLRALEYREKIADAADADMPTLLSNLVALYNNLGRPTETISFARRAVSWFDANRQERSVLGYDLFHMGRAQRKLGQLAEAETSLLRAQQVFDRVLPEGDPQHIAVRYEIGSLYLSQEKYFDAEQAYQSALGATLKLAKPDTAWRSVVLSDLGMTFRETARYLDAERQLLEAVKLEEAVGGERKPQVAQRLTVLASIYRRQNRYADAESALLKALTLEQPALDRATTLNALGLIYTTIDQYEKAEPLLKEALDIRTRGLPVDSAPALETISNLASVDSAMGRYADAEAKLRHALRATDVAGQTQATGIALQALLLSQVLTSEGKLDEADILAHRAFDIYQQQLGRNHPRFGSALKSMALIESLRGRDRNAEEYYRQALAIDEKIIGPQSPALAADLMNLVPLLKRAGKRQEAKTDVERALAINTAQFGSDSPVTTGAMTALANMAYEEGRYVEARALVDRARLIRERVSGPEHYSLAGSWIFAARLDIVQGRLDDASANMDRAGQIMGKTVAADHPSIIDLREGDADVARARGKPADAEQHLRAALAITEKLYEPDHPIRRTAIDRLAGELWTQGKFADAERLQRDELADIELKRGPDHPSTAVAIRAVANILGNSGRPDEAATFYRRLLTIDERSFGPQSDQAAWDHYALGSLLRRAGRLEQARVETNLARNAWESQGHLLAANSSLEQLALLALDQGSPAEGVIFAEQMLKVTEQVFGSDSPALAAMLAQLGRLYIAAGRSDAAGTILARINSLVGDNPPEQTPGFLGILQFRSQLNAERGNLDDAEAGFVRAIALAEKYGGPQGSAVGSNSYNLAALYLKMDRSRDAISYFARALNIFKRESGDRAPAVGYALAGAAQAYSKIGDEASSKALLATAIEILGPSIAARRPQPRWL